MLLKKNLIVLERNGKQKKNLFAKSWWAPMLQFTPETVTCFNFD